MRKAWGVTGRVRKRMAGYGVVRDLMNYRHEITLEQARAEVRAALELARQSLATGLTKG